MFTEDDAKTHLERLKWPYEIKPQQMAALLELLNGRNMLAVLPTGHNSKQLFQVKNNKSCVFND